MGQMIYNAFQEFPWVYTIQSPFAELLPRRRIELQTLKNCRALTYRVVAIHVSQSRFTKWKELVPKKHHTMVHEYFAGTTDCQLTDFSEKENTGNIIGMAIYGDVQSTAVAAKSDREWVVKVEKYLYYTQVFAMISLNSPIGPHKGDCGIGRNLGLNSAFALREALTKGLFKLQVGEIKSFSQHILQPLRAKVLADTQELFDADKPKHNRKKKHKR
jgi:hypothetical protein